MSLFQKRVTAKEFADGMWISVSHATKNFTKIFWSDFEKENDFKFPSKVSFENFAVEALLFNFWIAGKVLGTRRQASLDQLAKSISGFLLLKLSVDDPESLIMQRFKQYHGLMDKKDMQEFGYQVCENLYRINMADFLSLDSKSVFTLPIKLVGWINPMMEAFLKVESEFKIID